MSIIAPDQLPTPAQIPAPAPLPVVTPAAVPSVVPATAVGRPSNGRRLAIAGAAGAAVLVLAGAGVGLAGGGAAEGDGPTSTVDGGNETIVSAGNASVDVAGAYAALFGVSPAADVTACIEAEASPVIADVQAVVDGTAGSIGQITSGLAPFAACVTVDDFDLAMVTKATSVVAPAQLDETCAYSVLETFTGADVLDVLVTAATDPAQYDDRVYTTFGGCSF